MADPHDAHALLPPTLTRMRGSVTVWMAAPADEVWALLADVTRIGEFSPETFEAQWLDGATGPSTGARFRGHVRRNGRGPVYWTTCTVVACEPGREFAFTVGAPGRPVNTWRYLLATEVSDGVTGTSVTESFELAPVWWLQLYWRLAGRWRGRTNTDGMRATLDRVKAVAEAG